MTSTQPRTASPVDVETYGPYMPKLPKGMKARPGPTFQGRISVDGSSGFRSEPGRYHLYAAYPCPWSHRSAIVRVLKGLEDVVSFSVVDPIRDGRGWAFRKGEGHGLDQVNGFAFLSEAYEATEPDYEGHVSVPVLWDKQTGRIASNDYHTLSLDLGTQFEEWADTNVDLYPEALRAEIDAFNEMLYEKVNNARTVPASRSRRRSTSSWSVSCSRPSMSWRNGWRAADTSSVTGSRSPTSGFG